MTSQLWHSIYVDVTSGCNYRCDYCFRDFNIPFERISNDVIDDLVSWLRSNLQEHGKITFFGGEPLLAFREIKQIIAKLGDHAQYDMTTNGSLLDSKKIKYLKSHNIPIMISMDGMPISHNMYRIDRRGNNTWGATFAGLRKALRAGLHVDVAMTITPETLPYLKESLYLNWSLGVKKLVLNRVDGWPTPWDINKLRNALWIAANFWWTHKEEMSIWPIGQTCEKIYKLNRKIPTYRRRSCGACYGSVGIDWTGTIYPCHRMHDFAIGNIHVGIDEHSLKTIKNKDRDECFKCPVYPCNNCHVATDEQTCVWQKVRYEVCYRLVKEKKWRNKNGNQN